VKTVCTQRSLDSHCLSEDPFSLTPQILFLCRVFWANEYLLSCYLFAAGPSERHERKYVSGPERERELKEKLIKEQEKREKSRLERYTMFMIGIVYTPDSD